MARLAAVHDVVADSVAVYGTGGIAVNGKEAADGATPKTDADRQFVADMTELGVAMLQSFNEIAYQLGEIVDRMDRMRP